MSKLNKKGLIITILIVLVLGVIGCSQKTTTSSSQSSSTNQESTTTSTAANSNNTSTPTGILAIKGDGAPSIIDPYPDQTSIELTLIDPNTAKSQLWKHFKKIGNANLCIDITTPFFNRMAFTPNFDRIAAEEYYSSNGATHVGWITSDGKYVDVTKAIMPQQSDFSDAIKHVNAKFGADGMFYFQDLNRNVIKKVDPNNLSAGSVEVAQGADRNNCVQFYIYPNGNLTMYGIGSLEPTRTENIKKGYFGVRMIEDWLDSDTMLKVEDNQIYTCTAYTDATYSASGFSYNRGSILNVKELLPKTSRSNYNPISSPDGQQVAFLSKPLVGNEPPKIFLVSRNGGDPIQVKTDYVFNDGVGENFSWTRLLSWF